MEHWGLLFARMELAMIHWPDVLTSLHRRSILLLALLVALPLSAETVTMKSGMQFEGSVGLIDSLSAPILNPMGTGGSATGIKHVMVIDDNLRRTLVPKLQVLSGPIPSPETFEKIKVDQRVNPAGFQVNTVGPILGSSEWDEWGRRRYSMMGPKGRIDLVQGITEVTPTYTKVQALAGGAANLVWDMRIATSSLSRRDLSRILKGSLDPKKASDRLRIVAMFIQADRIQDARVELEEVVKDFPDLGTLKDQVDTLRQMGAQRLIKEIKVRQAAGQHRLAYAMAAEAPVKDVADATILSFREINEDYAMQKGGYDKTLENLSTQLKEITDDATRNKLQPFCQEIARDLNVNTMDRMADFNRLLDDAKLTADQKVSLAVTGWILGSGSGTENTAVAMSLCDVRNLVREYLVAKRKVEREEILYKLKSLEGSSPAYLAKIVAHMRPPQEPPKEEEPMEEGSDMAEAKDQSMPTGLTEIKIPGMGEDGEFTYLVQLPPEYDSYRKYPCVVTLHGQGTTPNQQIDWWAGQFSEKAKVRAGQATRQGYIVIAPKWTKDLQQSYEYSAREHAAVLYSLRDAMQKFAIDSNRVFLSGHSLGGDAVWDIALAHPDLWAGTIIVGGNVDKFPKIYEDNARYVPLYFIGGEKDGSRSANNLTQWDEYFKKAGYDVMVVEYLGRGHEHYYDEIQRIFEWMKVHERNFVPKEFEVTTARSWDNFFWWMEVEDLPARSVLSPFSFPTKLPPLAKVQARLTPNNGIAMTTAAKRGQIYLSPKMVDFDKKMPIKVNNKDIKVDPKSETLLEDVRTRGDRQQPFWAKASFGQ